MTNWIFPIAGKGTRTQEHGKFKPFIDIAGKMMIERCIDNLRSKFSKDDEFYFVTTKAFEKEFNVTEIMTRVLREYSVTVIKTESTPPGQAYSVRYAVNAILNADRDKDNDNPCIVVNCDQLTLFDMPDILLKHVVFMPIYFTSHGKSCYVQIRTDVNRITNIEEKKLISNYASSGTFIFGSVTLLKNCINWGIDYVRPTTELYLGPCINYVIENRRGHVIPITTYMKIDLGTDEQIEKYLKYLDTLRFNSYYPETHGHYE